MTARVVSKAIDLTSAPEHLSRYITKIDQNGITVHPETLAHNSYYTIVDGNGLKVNRIAGTEMDTTSDTLVAGFGRGSTGSYSGTGTQIYSAGSIAFYPNNASCSGPAVLSLYKYNDDEDFITFNGYYRSPEPLIKVYDHSHADMSITQGTITKIPMSDDSIDLNNGDSVFEILSNGNIQQKKFDGIFLEFSASAYVIPSAQSYVGIFIYHISHSGSSSTPVEIAAGGGMLTTNGGVVRISSVIPESRGTAPFYMEDEFYMAVRSLNSAATVKYNNKDTYFQIKMA